MKIEKTQKTKILLPVVLIITIILIFSYLITRTFLFLSTNYYWYEKIVAFFLLLAETFILIHSTGYFLNLFHVAVRPRPGLILDPYMQLKEYPPVAIIVSSYKEPVNVIEDTITCFYNLTYPDKRLYFLDDTRYNLPGTDKEKMDEYRNKIEWICERTGINLFRRTWHGAKAGMINDFLDFLKGTQKEGFSYYPFQQVERNEKEKYIIIFDADMNVFPDFVERLVDIMEKNPRLAFIQTPQYYTNFEHNRVARASGLQQAIFYEYICEGKSIQDAMFCCGTNVIFRIDALMDVNGFDESSVTEDFATSFRFHKNGWRSAYLNHVCAFGMGPEDLGGYFKQQFRWALGTVGLFRSIIVSFIKNPTSLPFGKWWEYFLSGTHYFIGWVFIIMVYCPVLYLFFNVPTFFASPEIYLLFFTPYIIVSMIVFISTFLQRGYRAKELFQGILLSAISFPVYIKASTLAILGVRGSFEITPKDKSSALPLYLLWPQLVTAFITFIAFIWGLNRLYYEHEHAMAIIVNSFWCLYHFVILSSILYFNHPRTE
jgi:cellulose synthase (UDP-forming)